MSEDIYHLDFETYSASPIKDVGAFRYAEDDTTEILIMAIAKNNEPPVVWSVWEDMNDPHRGIEALYFYREAVESGAVIYAHNSQFEDAVCTNLSQKTFGIPAPKPEQWRCTAAMARRAAIPSSLGQAGAFLGIEEEKDKEGARLIRKFSIPRKPTKKDPSTRMLPSDDVEDFQKFVDYCVQDVEAEREIHKKLASFELKGSVLDSFQFDLRMNKRGVPVNVEALAHCQDLIEKFEARETRRFIEMMGFKPSQTAVCLKEMKRAGYPFEDLTAANVQEILEQGADGWEARYVEFERWEELQEWFAEQYQLELQKLGVEKLPQKEKKAVQYAIKRKAPAKLTTKKLQAVTMQPEAFKALQIKAGLAYAAVKKVRTMLNASCKDGVVRGSLLWSGAERTHRWAGRIIQPQNFKRSTKTSEEAYNMICAGADLETMEMLFGSFLATIAGMVRHFIQRPTGQLLQADFSSVEGRGAPWLCDGEAKLQRFRDGRPIYEEMAAKIFGCTPEQVVAENKAGDSSKRFIGKQAELGCTYNMGRPKFRGTCENFKFSPTAKMIEEYKPIFKARYQKLLKAKQSPEPWSRDEIKFPPFQFCRLRNKKGFKKKGSEERAITREVQVWAYRKGGSQRLVKDPLNPTPEEWVDLTYDDLADRAVSAWRADNKEIVKAWKEIDIAAKNALRHPGKVFKATSKITFGVTEKPGFRALVMKLPSGHTLIYPKAKLVWNPSDEHKDATPDRKDNFNTEIQFWGKVPTKSTWGWCKTYGGKLLENATQAICGDFMANGACKAEEAGYEAFMLVHDELIGPHYEGQSHEELCELLCDLPAWAEGMPLEADGNLIKFYMKT